MFQTAISIHAVSLAVGVVAVAVAMVNCATCVENPPAVGATATRAVEGRRLQSAPASGSFLTGVLASAHHAGASKLVRIQFLSEHNSPSCYLCYNPVSRCNPRPLFFA